jgi:hypothetical protein
MRSKNKYVSLSKRKLLFRLKTPRFRTMKENQQYTFLHYLPANIAGKAPLAGKSF